MSLVQSQSVAFKGCFFPIGLRPGRFSAHGTFLNTILMDQCTLQSPYATHSRQRFGSLRDLPQELVCVAAHASSCAAHEFLRNLCMLHTHEFLKEVPIVLKCRRRKHVLDVYLDVH